MGQLAESVLEYIRGQGFLKAGDRAGVAVSGGADSVALLRLLLELRREIGVVLSVVHFNHGLRGSESETDERFVAQLAACHELELHRDHGDVTSHAQVQYLSIEAAARDLRYQYFYRLMGEERLSCVATGHTLDDQAETVLLRLVRGAGIRGLAGIFPELTYAESTQLGLTDAHYRRSADATLKTIRPQLPVLGSRFSVIRPLLRTERAQLETYLREIGQDWREDSSNRDLRHARNRIRHGIIPRLERTLNPKVKEALAETAEIARSEEDYWRGEVERVLPEVWDAPNNRLRGLSDLPLALRRRVIRAAAESLGLTLEFRHVEEILGLGLETTKSVELPGGWTVARANDGPHFTLAAEVAVSDYEYFLAVPGVVEVPEAGSSFEAAVVSGGAAPGYNPDHMLDPALLKKDLIVRNWRAGDRFWPAHSKSPKKLKELLQERKLAGRERKLWPVVVSGGEIVWVRGFPAPARLRPREGATEALVIQEYRNA